MKTAVILHGTMGSPDGNWFRWLEKTLTDRGLAVWLPALPHPGQPSLREEADFVHGHCPFGIDEDSLIIGHSSGAILALILAQESSMQIGGLVAVSVFHDNSLGWDANNHLFDVPFEWHKIPEHAQRLLFVHSDTDPYVPLSQAQYVADNCHGELVVIPDQGHFNLERSESYKAFPKLIDLLDKRHLL